MTDEVKLLTDDEVDRLDLRSLDTSLDYAETAQLIQRIPALCATVRALREMVYLPKILPDDEEVTYQDQAGRLLREKVASANEAHAVLDALGDNAVHVREEGRPEDIYASLAVSVAKLQSANTALREQLADAIKARDLFVSLKRVQTKRADELYSRAMDLLKERDELKDQLAQVTQERDQLLDAMNVARKEQP